MIKQEQDGDDFPISGIFEVQSDQIDREQELIPGHNFSRPDLEFHRAPEPHSACT